MNNEIWYLHTDEELGRSEERLRQAASLRLGISPSDGRLQPQRDGRGKLYFPLAPTLHCSVSHSGGIWLCALSGLPVGVDLQRHQPCPWEKIAARFFSDEETSWLNGQPAACFFDVWCAKESYLKYTGAGMELGLDCFSAVAGSRLADAVLGVPLRHIPFVPDFSLCLCGGTADEVALRVLPKA
ncbi:MAG: 4'-phosphopantetheinyl transferase superfamily protein [Oscillospiraceae bacterium]|nr:4'-phosphopantetheinyl transferase superfamily protein [Oscillospiraceae bacterium]